MVDVTNAQEVANENRGINEKLWIDVNGRVALLKITQIKKETQESTHAHSAEVFTSDICKLLGYNCAEVDVAQKNGEIIGCVSYNFLQEGEQLIDFNALIQNIRPSFKSKAMEVKETGEKYSIPLILEAIEEECNTKEEYYNVRKEFLKGCLIDSIIEHYDRNSSNLAVIKNKNGIRYAPLYDNGTSLEVSVPKEAVYEKLKRSNWLKEDREKVKSKIGIDGERCSSYDKIEEFILSNYYGDVRELLLAIKEKLIPENIISILIDNNYKDLDDIYKKSVFMKVKNNSTNILEKSKMYEQKYIMEQYMSGKEIASNLGELAKHGELQKIIPEIQECIKCPQRNKYHIYNVDEYMFKVIENIDNIEEIAKKYEIKLPKMYDQEKNTIKWAVMLNEIGKPGAREEINENGQIRDRFLNYTEISKEKANTIMDRLKFYPKNRETILSLIDTHKRLEFNTQKPIKRLINALGEKNINEFIAMKLGEYEARSPETKEKNINELKKLQEQINEILGDDSKKIIKVLPLNGKFIAKRGLSGKDVGKVLDKTVACIKRNEKIKRYYDAKGHFEKYKKKIKEAMNEIIEEVKDDNTKNVAMNEIIQEVKEENIKNVAMTVNSEQKQNAINALEGLEKGKEQQKQQQDR